MSTDIATIDDSKHVLVTGATAGIGRALALAIADLPSHPRVIAAGRRKDRLDELKKSNLETIEVDLDTDKAGLEKFVDETLQKYPEVRFSVTGCGPNLTHSLPAGYHCSLCRRST